MDSLRSIMSDSWGEEGQDKLPIISTMAEIEMVCLAWPPSNCDQNAGAPYKTEKVDARIAWAMRLAHIALAHPWEKKTKFWILVAQQSYFLLTENRKLEKKSLFLFYDLVFFTLNRLSSGFLSQPYSASLALSSYNWCL